jgi:DNA-binding MarR family transcriptional regulator
MFSRRMKLIDIDEVEEPDTILRTFILFSQSAREVLKYVDAHLYREAGLSVVQLIALQAMSRNNGVMTPSGIAEWTQTERHNITTLIRRMKKAGLVTTERSLYNKKVINVTMTDKGREVLAGVMPLAHRIVDQVMLSFTEDDAALLERLLRPMRLNAHSGLEALSRRAQH